MTIKLRDQITTDDIIPAGSVSRHRSNIEKSSDFIFQNIDPDFAKNCNDLKSQKLASIIVAGVSYGQGSSREHAAICPMYLGVREVIAKSIERIQMANLVNLGIMPLPFKETDVYETLQRGDELEILDTFDALRSGEFVVANNSKQNTFLVYHDLTPRQIEIALHGGLLNYTAAS